MKRVASLGRPRETASKCDCVNGVEETGESTFVVEDRRGCDVPWLMALDRLARHDSEARRSC